MMGHVPIVHLFFPLITLRSLPLDLAYEWAQSSLKKVFSGSTTDDIDINAMLEVLQKRKKDPEDQADNNGGTGTTDENMTDDEGMEQDLENRVGDAFRTLVENATEEFGFSPCDVYQGVFTLYRIRSDHKARSRRLNYSEHMDQFNRLIKTWEN